MATNKVFCSYQEVIDLHTDADKVSAIGIHTPVGDTPSKMFGGFFDQFKKYKYLGADVTFVPAARLPVDPLGVSYDAGEPTIDPRDLLNPIMFHGCHGQDLNNILNTLYTFGDISSTTIADKFGTDSADMLNFIDDDANGGFAGVDMKLLENLYYKALTDNGWKKAHPQKGFRKSGLRPLVYKVAATHQILPNQGMGVTDEDNIATAGIDSIPDLSGTVAGNNLQFDGKRSGSSLEFLTNKLTGLGWLDTRTPLNSTASPQDVNIEITSGPVVHVGEALTDVLNAKSHISRLPNIYMGILLLPPAYKTKQYFRMVINHKFAFAGFRSMSFQNDFMDKTPAYFNQDF